MKFNGIFLACVIATVFTMNVKAAQIPPVVRNLAAEFATAIVVAPAAQAAQAAPAAPVIQVAPVAPVTPPRPTRPAGIGAPMRPLRS